MLIWSVILRLAFTWWNASFIRANICPVRVWEEKWVLLRNWGELEAQEEEVCLPGVLDSAERSQSWDFIPAHDAQESRKAHGHRKDVAKVSTSFITAGFHPFQTPLCATWGYRPIGRRPYLLGSFQDISKSHCLSVLFCFCFFSVFYQSY